MPVRRPSQLPLPSETTRITRHSPSQPPQTTTQPSEQYAPQHTCTKPNCAVQQVLSTPELLENTLNSLPTRDILSLQRVSKTWRTLINSSPSLRFHFFLEPQWRRPAIDFQLLPCTAILGLQIRRGERVHLGQWIEARMTPDAAREIVRTTSVRSRRSRKTDSTPPDDYGVELGKNDQRKLCPSNPPTSPRRRISPLLSPQQTADLLLTQPPLVGVQAFVVVADEEPHSRQRQDCQNGNVNVRLPSVGTTSPSPSSSEPDSEGISIPSKSTTPSHHSKLACDAGITLGFMADVAHFLLRDWELTHGGGGGGGGEKESDPDGEQQEEKAVVVVFRAIVSFCSQTDGAPRVRSGTRFVTGVE